jgi:hypothetical protein
LRERGIPAIVLTIVCLAPTSAVGQTSSFPHTANGKPDLQGVWQVLNTAAWDIQDHNAQLGVPPGPGVVEGNEIPYKPSAAAKKKDNFESRTTADPETKCYLPGVPRIMYMPHPFQIFQTPGLILFVYERGNVTRIVYTNGSKHPDAIDFWMGDSRGHWDGETLVIDVTNFNAETWFDRAGNFHSDALHMIERYTLMDADHISYQALIEDPKVFTRPWNMSMVLYRRTDPHPQLMEDACAAYLLDDASGR